jgi:hypothetical protein
MRSERFIALLLALAALLAEARESRPNILFLTLISHARRALLRQDRRKLVSIDVPFDERNFSLYDIAVDPGETIDLSAVEPDKRAELLRIWRRERRRLGIVLPEDL